MRTIGPLGGGSECSLQWRSTAHRAVHCCQRATIVAREKHDRFHEYTQISLPARKCEEQAGFRGNCFLTLYQGCSLGLERLGLEAVSRRFLERFGLISVLKI